MLVFCCFSRDDGWWTGEDKDGKTGLVPSTLLKVSASTTISCGKLSAQVGETCPTMYNLKKLHQIIFKKSMPTL